MPARLLVILTKGIAMSIPLGPDSAQRDTQSADRRVNDTPEVGGLR
jgi:hypothetical protein